MAATPPLGVMGEAIRHARHSLTAAGLSATEDVRSLALPGVWITVESLDWQRLSGSVDVELALFGVAGNAGGAADIAALDTLTAKISATLGADTADLVSITLPNHGGTLPAVRILTTLTVQEEEL